MRTYVLLAVLLLGGPALAKDRTTADYLRAKHAGTAALESNEPVADLFPKIRDAAGACWAGTIKPGTAGPLWMSSASRSVIGELAPNRESAYVAVQAKGFFGALQDNFLQVDLAGQDTGGTHLTVYYKNNVKLQRQFVDEVKRWLAGELDYCGKEGRHFNKPKSG